MSASVVDFRSIEGALLRYRIMAVIVGISIIILVFIALPLKIWGNSNGLAAGLGFPHGVILYPIYIILTLDLARRVRIHPLWAIAAVIAGTVPFVSFYSERKITELVRLREAELAAATPAAATA
jgi:integral membrane protein